MNCPKCGKDLRTGKHPKDGFPTYVCTKECGYNEPQCFGIGNCEQSCMCCPEETRCIETEYGPNLREQFRKRFEKKDLFSDKDRDRVSKLFWSILLMLCIIVGFDLGFKATLTFTFALFITIISGIFLIGFYLGKLIGKKGK